MQMLNPEMIMIYMPFASSLYSVDVGEQNFEKLLNLLEQRTG